MKDATHQRKHRARTSQEVTAEPGWSCSDGETPPKHTRGSGSAAGPVEPLQGRRQTAPTFSLRSERKGVGGGERCGTVEAKHRPAALASQTDDVQRVKGQRMLSASAENEAPWSSREQLSALNICLEHIQTSSPTFPVRAVFSALQQRARAGPRHLRSPGSLQNHVNEKRKRADDSSEASKRQRSRFAGEAATGKHRSHIPAQDAEESVVLPETRRRSSSKLSRAHRLRQQSGGSANAVSIREPVTAQAESSATAGSGFEDVLWTDKYSPQHSGEVIGNSAAVNALHRWLKKWKLRADTEERNKVEARKEEANDSWDCGDFQGEAGADDVSEESPCNTMLITGPPGVGKTASVYACALELGFKVFEVNCSSQRSGRHVLAQLKEATQSHLVGTSGKDPLKPAHFKTYATNSCSPKSETLPGTGAVHPKNVICTTKKRAKLSSGRRRGNANQATGTLANYFKMKARADGLCFGGLSSTVKPNTNKLSSPSPDCDHAVPQSRRTATSLILFEEVDVIFEDDVGFLAAIKTFMTTTKRPVVLTTTDPLFRERFNHSLDEIIFKTPSAVSICSYLQLVALAEAVQLQVDDVGSLVSLARGDVRRCLLQLQLWVHSGARRASLSGSLLKEPVCAPYAGCLDPQLVPSCETGCTSSLLGLEPLTQIQMLNYLKSQSWSETDTNKLLMLLAESWRQRVPLLYSNLELLLPIRAYGTSGHCLQNELTRTDTHRLERQLSGNVTSEATDSEHVRKISRLSRRKRNTCATTLVSGVRQRGRSLHRATSRAQTSSDKIEQKAAVVETEALVALSDFFDLMSYVDAMLPAAAPLVSGSCRPEDFVWTGAEMKDGLLDERREEEGSSWSQEHLLNIQAAVEGLGCHRCCLLMTEAQKLSQTMEDKLQERPLVLPAASKTQRLNFRVQPLCPPSVSQRRFELSKAVFGSESFSLLGNRRAVGVDYMPILRSICRSQRAQQHSGEPVRYRNYTSGTCLGLSKSTLKLLAEEFS